MKLWKLYTTARSHWINNFCWSKGENIEIHTHSSLSLIQNVVINACCRYTFIPFSFSLFSLLWLPHTEISDWEIRWSVITVPMSRASFSSLSLLPFPFATDIQLQHIHPSLSQELHILRSSNLSRTFPSPHQPTVCPISRRSADQPWCWNLSCNGH